MSIKISELPQASTVNNTDIIPIVQNGTTKQATAGMINANSYSTTEQRVGTWIDGKPMYRKVFIADNIPFPSGSYITIGTINNVDTAIKADYLVGGVGAKGGRTGYLSANYYYGVQLSVLSTNELSITLWGRDGGGETYNIQYKIIVEYTKSTDSATRSLYLTKSANTGELVGTGDRVELTDETKKDDEQAEKQVENISEEKQEEKQNEAEPIEATKIETKTEGSGDNK